ncbi:MAG: hypothetical protein K5921_07220 [Lachnospiraceae bacterium]|nr:hypothetical protein [Lachnospiraceae bacterium]
MNEYRYITGRIILALFVIIASFMPFFVIADMIRKFTDGNREPMYYVEQIALIIIFLVIRKLLRFCEDIFINYSHMK